MAAQKTSQSVIDNLPEAQRRKVVDALLAGESLRAVAKIAGVSHTQVDRYKRNTVMPALKAAQQVQSLQPLPETNMEAIRQQAVLTRDIVRASPFRDRLEKLWERTDKALDKVEKTQDLAPMAPLLNQAHKNCEMLGRATGELESAANNSVAIQIVMPAGPAYGQRFEAEAIEIAMPKR